MAYKRKYTKSGENVIATYDQTDIAAGTGFATFYGVGTSYAPGIATIYGLTDDATLISNTNSASTSTSTTINFDTSAFNRPLVVRGQAVVSFCFRNTVGSSTSMTVSAQLKKVASDGTTITNLGSAITVYHDGTNGSSALGATSNEQFLGFMEMTETVMEVDSKLRCTIILTDNDAEQVAFYFDPQGRDLLSDTTVSTQLKVLLPQKIDL